MEFKKNFSTANNANVFLICFFLGVFADNLHARFDHLDADSLNPESDGTEIVIDIKSYEFLRSMNYKSLECKSKYRFTVGSLNANRFYLLENIHLESDLDTPINFSFSRFREEDLSESIEKEEFRAIFSVAKDFYFAFLADGNTNKKFGDLGFAAIWQNNLGNSFEIYHYLVDFYYQSKEWLEDSYYIEKPLTNGMKFQLSKLGPFSLKGFAEVDAPTTWHRGTIDTIYSYKRRHFELNVEYKVTDAYLVNAKTKFDYKKQSLEKISSTLNDSLKRETKLLDLSMTQLEDDIRQYSTLGAQWYSRNADFDLANLASDGDFLNKDRIDFIPYWQHYRPFFDVSNLYLQLGLYYAKVEIDKEEVDAAFVQISETEIKFQSAFEYDLMAKGSMVFNANWNIDRLIDHFPYDQKEFSPWNGGSVQFQLLF